MSKAPKYELGDDGLPVEVVGPWAKKKLKILADYIVASSAARRKFYSECAYVDVFCGPGRARVRDTAELIDGSPLVAVKRGKTSLSAFSSIHLSDANAKLLEAAAFRSSALHNKVVTHPGPAIEAVASICKKIDPNGLHLAFVDPYNLGNLSFALFEEFAKFKAIDVLVHVSVSDLRRNVDRYTAQEFEQFDIFAPGWRSHINEKNHSKQTLRTEILKYWSNKIEKLGLPRAFHQESIRNTKGQELYWLLLLSGHDLPHKLYKEIGSAMTTGELF